MKLVVAQVEGGIDGLEWLEVDVDFLFFTLFCYNRATVDNLNDRLLLKA